MTPRLEALRAIKRQIVDERCYFICTAICQVMEGHSRGPVYIAAMAIRAEIQAGINQQCTLEFWIGSEVQTSLCPAVYGPMARLAWLDKLIEKEYDAHR